MNDREFPDGREKEPSKGPANEFLAARFESHRSQLRAVAYRMLGSGTEADDAVQETWFRLSRTDTTDVGNLAGWLTTVVGRVCLDMLRARKSRAEQPLDTWTPADSRAQPPSSSRTADPERDALLADSVGAALIVVLDTLTPAERLAFVLHDLFGVPFEEVARIVDRTPASARQLASRARRRVRGAPARGAGADRRREVVGAFLAAARDGDFDALVAVLDPDVVARSEAGVTTGAAAVASGARSFARLAVVARPVLVGGEVGLAVYSGAGGEGLGSLERVLTFTFVHEKVAVIDIVTDPERLARLRVTADVTRPGN
ncbi:sigma-70 family RNA polymerase sigma factor [Streptomyces sp. NBC_01538]|uniref:sigma-70 family RNA polymerase sigma factor n=1 Tax=Streptomyces sp. NBC_01538 TaxID=2903897 RepID=UPI00386BDD3E